ncbi:ABC transporter permease [Latilactobacillus curvatus]|uniref:ABC transporter permease n=2 Tax=Latilactobacillus curvatus TaxID=28038 RepID=A0A385AD87_LATCU|nr:branched-chain amino acid ABC transporter permease [Latilactobacillus curvatus]AXN35669.1 ABC transporter permease [Latilactobacillus curvatus]EHE86594.1 branched-chain amino acid transport system / permease component family protein [Latilactobacillus curvatus CRL 705]KRK93473.1 branched-chain amino acid transport system permease component family protein [Latilactobacillus curvatus JCM 1096 = DSM 20019]MCM6843862.1 ABC transporter permease [Latilactobacillus curvatus]MCM6861251.1 ABC transp
MNLIISTIDQGLLWSLLSLGVFITFRILKFPDMTVEGSFPLGAALSALMLQQHNIAFSLLVAFIGGCLAGLVTAILYNYFHVQSLLAGILTLTGLYSVNLRILGQANMAIGDQHNLYQLPLFHQLTLDQRLLVINLVIMLIALLLLAGLLYTEFGQSLIAAGDNPTMALSQGIAVKRTKTIGIVLSNGLIALAGGLVAQYNGFADVNMGIGVMVIGLSAIIIGERLLVGKHFIAKLISIILGSVVYRLILLLVLQLGFNANDFKLFSAVILAIFIIAPQQKKGLTTK